MKLLLSKRTGKHNSHSDLSFLPCQTLFITLNIIEYPTGPFALAQHSAVPPNIPVNHLVCLLTRKKLKTQTEDKQDCFEHLGLQADSNKAGL